MRNFWSLLLLHPNNTKKEGAKEGLTKVTIKK